MTKPNPARRLAVWLAVALPALLAACAQGVDVSPNETQDCMMGEYRNEMGRCVPIE